MMADLNKRLVDKKIKVVLSNEADDFIIENAYDPVFGARPLRRYLQHSVETLLARALIAAQIQPNTEIKVTVQDGKLKLDI